MIVIEQKEQLSILKILSGKWVFSAVLATLIFLRHCALSQSFLERQTLKLSILLYSGDLIQQFPGVWALFRMAYRPITAAGLWIICFVGYRTFLEPLLKGRAGSGEPLEGEISPPPFPWSKDKLQMIVGLKHQKMSIEKVRHPAWVIVPEKGMFQNFLIAGTIGMGKTAGVMYTFTKQAIFYKARDNSQKAGMLILDVKGNYYRQVLEFAAACGRTDDVIVIELGGEYKYNPLHKPDMEAIDLAERSRIVMDLFTGGARKEAFWDTKSSQMMCECIRLMRMVNYGYVTLGDIHRLVTDREFKEEKVDQLYVCEHEVSAFDFRSAVSYFTGEFHSKAENTIETVKACVTEMTAFFASSERIYNSFCPDKEQLNFLGFQEAINLGKIVVLAMSPADHPKMARTIAAYLKLDFQAEMQRRTVPGSGLNKTRPMFFICDEYQEFVTANDANFYGVSREARCCSIVSSQSYTSMLKTLGDDRAFNTLQQNLINKIWLRSDDKLTIETAQFLTGREEKRRVAKNISESAADTKKSRLFGKMVSDKASVSESINISMQRDHVFEEKVFTQNVKLFTGVCFLAHEQGMQEPTIVHLLPHYEPPVSDKMAIPLPQENLLSFTSMSAQQIKLLEMEGNGNYEDD